jgi:hypothetical protein
MSRKQIVGVRYFIGGAATLTDAVSGESHSGNVGSRCKRYMRKDKSCHAVTNLFRSFIVRL